MITLEKMTHRQITSANYITSVNGMLHPDRRMSEHDFLYILDGEWEVIQEGCRYTVHTDDLLILTAGLHHWGEKLCNPGNRHMYFHIKPTKTEIQENCGVRDVRGERAGDCMDEMESKSPSSTISIATLLHCQGTPSIRRYFQELISAYWSREEQKEDRMSLLFNLLLCNLTALQSRDQGIREDALVEQIRRQLQSNPQVFFTAKEMAASLYICPRTLNNRFQKAYGKTFYAYQMEQKLEMVREYLLHQPEAKLHEAAVNFGFYDEFHLSKAFRKQYGYPPSRLRG